MDFGFDFYFPVQNLKAAVAVSLLSVAVLVGVCWSLNLHTRRRYFTIWTAGWLFYALWLTLWMSRLTRPESASLLLLQEWCVGMAAAFLLWGSVGFLRLRGRQLLFGLFLIFLLVWGYVAVFFLADRWWAEVPIFALMGWASAVAGWCFWRVGRRRRLLGADMLAAGFLLWGAYLGSYPFLQRSEHLISAGFFISAVLQLFIAVSMIVLVLEEARRTREAMSARMRAQKSDTKIFRAKATRTLERYRSLFEQASEGIIIAAADDGRILECNRTARHLLGFNGESASTLSLADFAQPATAAVGTGRGQLDWLRRLPQPSKVTLWRRDQEARLTEVRGAIVTFEGRSAYQLFVRDLTEQTQLEEQLRRAEKLSALGRMISGVAHELNNPLAVIKGYLELVLARDRLGSQTRADLEKVAHESDRAARLVRNFLAFARQQPTEREATDLNRLVRQVVELRQCDLAAGGVDWKFELAGDLAPTRVDANRMQQVLAILVSNALQALKERSGPKRLTLRTRCDRETLRIEVEDNGPGVPDAIVGRIFEPFFTTKAVGEGAGLGLSVAHGIVAEHEGKLYYRPAAGGGACFVVELPAIESAPGNPQPAPALEPLTLTSQPPSPLAATEILVVDDELLLAQMLAELLSLLGYRARICQNPIEALELVRTNDFALILSDFRMPQMDGRQFHAAVAQIKPALADRFIFITGDTTSPEAKEFLQSVGDRYLAKPFRLATVKETVSRVLAAA